MSIRLASRLKSPVDGFRFEQRETGWKSWTSDPITLWDFNALVAAVHRHRLANPRFKLSTSIQAIQDEMDFVNATRMKTIPGAESYYVEGSASFPNPLRSLAQSVGASVAAGRAINAGRKLISEWRAEGFEVVAKAEASRRAELCSDCPQNGKGDFATWFTVPMSEQIKKDIEELHQLKLTTHFDNKLGTCLACHCPLGVKVWTPLPLVLKHLLPESKAKLDPRCWIL